MSHWTWDEIETMWRHPDWTSKELAEILPHSHSAIRMQRVRMGRWNDKLPPMCGRCGKRVVWVESQTAKRYGLCKGCFLEEERIQLEEEALAVAIRQRRKKIGKEKKAGRP